MSRYIFIFVFSVKSLLSFSQGNESEVVLFDNPIRNSLKFNKFIINPTYSFVNENCTYATAYSKQQWVGFEGAPQSYFLSYSGRLSKKQGLGVALFQQSYATFTSFGLAGNFSHNVQIIDDFNITAGINTEIYRSGLNTAKAVDNYSDPVLANLPSNFVTGVTPAVNFGWRYINLGLSLNNIFQYNISTSSSITNDAYKFVGMQIMYADNLNRRDFLDDARLTALLRTDFGNNGSILTAITQLELDNGFWGRLGYNNFYGLSAGIGMAFNERVSLEYIFELGMGNTSNFGTSHELALAFKIDEKREVRYRKTSGQPNKVVVKSTVKDTKKSKEQLETMRAKREEEMKARKEAADKLREERLAKAKERADSLAVVREKSRIEMLEKTRINKEEALAAANAKKAADEAKAKAAATAEPAAVKTPTPKPPVVEDKPNQQDAAAIKAIAEANARIKAAQEAEAKAKAESDAKAKAAAAAAIPVVKEEPEVAPDPPVVIEEPKKEDPLAKYFKKEEDEGMRALEQARKKIKRDNEASEIAFKIKQQSDVAKGATVRQKMDILVFEINQYNRTQDEKLFKMDMLVAQTISDIQDLDRLISLKRNRRAMIQKLSEVSRDSYEMNILKTKLLQLNKEKEVRIKTQKALYQELIAKANATEKQDIEQKYGTGIKELEAKQITAERLSKDVLSSIEKTIKEVESSNDNVTNEPIMSNKTVGGKRLDFGNIPSTQVILKGVKDVARGYYLVIAVHKDTKRRDNFLKAVAGMGNDNINLFYDEATKDYYIYCDKYDKLEDAVNAVADKSNVVYKEKMIIVSVK